MPAPQAGILSDPKGHGSFITLALGSGENSVERARRTACGVRALVASLGHKDLGAHLECVVAFSHNAWDRLFPEPLRKQLDPIHRVPLGRVGEHQELANLAAYLMSDYSAYVNGEVITIDGGEWLGNAGQFTPFEAISDEMWDMWFAMRGKG